MSCAITCVEMADLDDDDANGRMVWIERVRYRLHLLGCGCCRTRVAQLVEDLRRQGRQTMPWIETVS
jgi:hypothetical protein